MDQTSDRPERQKEERASSAAISSAICRKVRDQRSSEIANGAGKVGQGRRKGIERQRGKRSNCRAQIKLQIAQIYQQTSVGGWSPGSLISRIEMRRTVLASKCRSN